MAMSVSSLSYFGFMPKPDAEWQRIINRLWNEFGVRSSGNKAADTQKLHELELQEAQKKASDKSDFLTLKEDEIEKIKKNKNENTDDKKVLDFQKSEGADILGKQIFLAIQMKQGEDIQDNKKKRNNKYQS